MLTNTKTKQIFGYPHLERCGIVDGDFFKLYDPLKVLNTRFWLMSLNNLVLHDSTYAARIQDWTNNLSTKMSSSENHQIYTFQDVPGNEKVSSRSETSLRARELCPKRPSLHYLAMQWTANSYRYPSTSKSPPSANTSNDPFFPYTTYAHIGMLLNGILGSFKPTRCLLKPTEVKGQSY